MQNPDARWLLDLLRSGGFRLLFFALTIVGLVLPPVAAIWARAVLDSPPDDKGPRAGAPPWLRRLALWFFALGTISALPVITGLITGRIAIHSGILLLFTGLGLWTASRPLRLLVLMTCGLGLGFGILSNSIFLIWLLRQGWLPTPEPGFGPIGGPLGLGFGLFLGWAELAGFVAAPLVLHRDDAQAAFGLAPRGKAGVPRASIGAAAVAGCVSLACGGVALMIERASVADASDRPTVLPAIPAGGDRVWFELQGSDDAPVRYVVNCWSNGVPHVVDAGVWNPAEFATADTTRRKQVHMIRAVRSGGAGQTWQVSAYLSDLPVGEEWQATGIPEAVPLRAVNTGAAVRLTPGERERRWLFLPQVRANQLSGGEQPPANPVWGISMELEWATEATAGLEVVSRMELQLPLGHATAIRTTLWNNGVPAPLPGAGLSLLPGVLSENTVLHWRLRRLKAPGEWELAVTGADDKKLLGPLTVHFGTNVPVAQPQPSVLTAANLGAVQRHWPFLSAGQVASGGVERPDSGFGWGIAVDAGPQAMIGAPTGTPKP